MNFGKKYNIVILHGWGLSGGRFDPLIQEFSHLGYKVFAPDLPGFGERAMPTTPLRLTDYVRFLDSFLTKNNISQPVLIGHSFGGRIALKYQKLHPKKTKALILTGTPGFTPVAKRKIVFFSLLAKLGKVFVALIPFPEFKEALRRWYYYVAGARDFYRARGVMRDIFKLVVNEELITSMLAVDCPCLLLWGGEDIIVPLAVADKMKHIIEGAKLVIVTGSDHGLPYKKPEEFATNVDQFLRSL